MYFQCCYRGIVLEMSITTSVIDSFCSFPPSDKGIFLVNHDHNIDLLSYPGSYNLIIFVSVSFEAFDNSKLSQFFSFFTYLLSNFSY